MANRFLTLNVGASQAVLAEYAIDGKRDLTLVGYGMAPLPPVDADSPGSMEAALTPALHQIMRENGIKPGPVVISLGGQSVFPRFARVPAVGDESKILEVVRYEVEQNVPFPMDEIVWGHQFLGDTPEGDRATIIVAAKLEMVRGVTNAVRAAGLATKIVDVAPMAVCNALRLAMPDLEGCNVVLDIGSKTTSLIIVENEKIYIRSIPVAGGTITRELAQTFGCTTEEAEQLKLERGYVSLGGVTEDPDEVTDRVSKVIRSVMTRLHAEIARSINFYRSQQGGSAPSRLFLTGGGALMPQLDQFFGETLRVEVDYLNPFGAVSIGANIDGDRINQDALILNESVGAALRMTDLAQMSIDLTPPEIIAEQLATKRIPFVIAGAVMIVIAGVLMLVSANRGVEVQAAVGEAIESVNSDLTSLQDKLNKEQKTLDAERAKADELKVLLLSRSTSLSRLDAVRKSLIGQGKDMWITEWKPVPAKRDEVVDSNTVLVTIRGWSDKLRIAEKRDAELNPGQSRTADEIVRENVKAQSPTVVDCRIKSRNDVKGCMLEFTLEVKFSLPGGVTPAKKPRKNGGNK